MNSFYLNFYVAFSKTINQRHCTKFSFQREKARTKILNTLLSVRKHPHHQYEYFYLCGFSFTSIHESQDCTGRRARGGGISLTPHYFFHSLHRHLDISWAITVQSLPLHIANSWTPTGNLWFPSASCYPLSYAWGKKTSLR